MELFLPFPPSLNGLYDGGHKSKRRFKSKLYRQWEVLAEDFFRRQLAQGFIKRVTDDCEIIIQLVRPDRRQRDVANYEKAVTDFLVSHNILEDDSLIVKNTQEWVRGDFECRVVINQHFIPASEFLRHVGATC